MPLYHISLKNYVIGDKIILSCDSIYHEKTVIEGKNWVNEFLDNNRPVGYPSRKKALYACDSISNCKALKNTVNSGAFNLNIYEVRMKNPIKAPMALVNFMLKMGEVNRFNVLIAKEYWEPSNDWKFYEYLSEEMEVINVIKNEDTSPAGKMMFWLSNGLSLLTDDAKRAEKIFIK